MFSHAALALFVQMITPGVVHPGAVRLYDIISVWSHRIVFREIRRSSDVVSERSEITYPGDEREVRYEFGENANGFNSTRTYGER